MLHDYVEPKVQHEERKLNGLRTEAGANPTSKQRKELTAQEAFVDELRAFKAEPDLNDGVILCFAPLWRLVPQHRAWQKECKKVWDELVAGIYHWAHLAKHLWPERVVPKCAEDRSLAIAHGLDDVFWQEDTPGKWQPRSVAPDTVQKHIAERSSGAVKSALANLLAAPAPGNGRRTSTKARKPRASRRRAPPMSLVTRCPPRATLGLTS